MNGLKNRVQLLGLVGKILGFSEIEKSRKTARFSLVTYERYEGKDGQDIIESNSHLIKAVGRLAERVEKRVKLGTELLVEGKLVYRKRHDNNNFLAEIQITEMIILSKTLGSSPEPKTV